MPAPSSTATSSPDHVEGATAPLRIVDVLTDAAAHLDNDYLFASLTDAATRLGYTGAARYEAASAAYRAASASGLTTNRSPADNAAAMLAAAEQLGGDGCR